MRCLISVLLLIFTSTAGLAAEFDFTPYGRILDRHLTPDQQIHNIPVNTLDYQALAEGQGASSDWHKLLGTLASFDPETITGHDARMAFWINVYNIAAIKTILDHWPVDSIRSRSIHWLKSPWKRPVILVGGQRYSLHQIEFDQLVDGFNDLRPHLGINCASTSCVDLIKTPYTGSKLDQQLQQQGKRLAKQPEKGLKIDRIAGKVYVSKIFDFDARRFEKLAGGPIDFLLPYITNPKDLEHLKQGSYDIEFLDYDWALNDSRRAD